MIRSTHYYMDQIFSLRNIIEQSTEWNAPLCIGFIDFKRAFDSIHHETLWKILRHYGLHQKIVGIISVLYKSFECSVLMDSTQTAYFPVKSGVRLGCILSPILFKYNPRLHYEADYTECTAWYTVDHVLTTRRPGLCR